MVFSWHIRQLRKNNPSIKLIFIKSLFLTPHPHHQHIKKDGVESFCIQPLNDQDSRDLIKLYCLREIKVKELQFD